MYLHLGCITVKGYRVKSAEARGASLGTPGTSRPVCSPSGAVRDAVTQQPRVTACRAFPSREAFSSWSVQAFHWGSVLWAYSTRMTDLGHSSSSPLEKKQMFPINHNVRGNPLDKLVRCGPRPQACKTLLSDRTFQEAGQGPILKTCLSWECSGLEQPRPAESTHSFTEGLWQKEVSRIQKAGSVLEL